MKSVGDIKHADDADDADFSFSLNGKDNSNRKKWHICQKFRLEYKVFGEKMYDFGQNYVNLQPTEEVYMP